jgi:hypothetical protein
MPADSSRKNLAKPALKTVTAVLLLIYFLNYALNPASGHFIDGVSLLIHEAGHIIFMPFGQFLYVAGGSLLQLIIPLLFIIYFYRRNDKFACFLLLFWLGQNLINISVYAGDAVAMKLPLLTEDSSNHDWNYLLIYLGWLHYTKTVAAIIFYSGILGLFAATGLSITAAWQKAESAV